MGRAAALRVVAVQRRGGAVEHLHHAFGNVVDIGEVAHHLAVIEDVDRPALEDRLGEQEQRHIRPAPGPVDGKKAQAGGRQPVQMAVGMRHQLIGLLGRGIEADRVVDVVPL